MDFYNKTNGLDTFNIKIFLNIYSTLTEVSRKSCKNLQFYEHEFQLIDNCHTKINWNCSLILFAFCATVCLKKILVGISDIPTCNEAIRRVRGLGTFICLANCSAGVI